MSDFLYNPFTYEPGMIVMPKPLLTTTLLFLASLLVILMRKYRANGKWDVVRWLVSLLGAFGMVGTWAALQFAGSTAPMTLLSRVMVGVAWAMVGVSIITLVCSLQHLRHPLKKWRQLTPVQVMLALTVTAHCFAAAALLDLITDPFADRTVAGSQAQEFFMLNLGSTLTYVTIITIIVVAMLTAALRIWSVGKWAVRGVVRLFHRL